MIIGMQSTVAQSTTSSIAPSFSLLISLSFSRVVEICFSEDETPSADRRIDGESEVIVRASSVCTNNGMVELTVLSAPNMEALTPGITDLRPNAPYQSSKRRDTSWGSQIVSMATRAFGTNFFVPFEYR
jgi:hypothetical protein